MNDRRPRLAYPFTLLTQPGTVRLVAGEDYRYTLTGAGIETWLPDLLARCKGQETLGKLLESLAVVHREAASAVIVRLYGERAVVDGPVAAAHVVRNYGRHVAGQGSLCERLRRDLTPDEGQPRIAIYCQDNLDFGAALAAQVKARQASEPFLWITYGPVQRAYVSPLLLADVGPCLACLVRTFRRLSPAPDIYDALLEHGALKQPFAAGDFPAEGIDVLHALVRWKLAQAETNEPPTALFRLHVVERATLEVGVERVFVDPECPQCHGGQP